jgi:pyruvate kinase
MESAKFDIEQLLKPVDTSKRRTKIICTLGPACAKIERMVEMLDAGMNVARLNFSHGDHKSHGYMLEKLREAK